MEKDEGTESLIECINKKKDETRETTDTCSEKNESKELDELFYCTDCKTNDCFMWRRLNNADKDLVCNDCHMKHLKNEQSNSQQSNITNNKSSSISSRNYKDTVRISKRKNKTNKKFTNGFYGDKIIKNGNSKSRRNLYKRKPTKSPVCNVAPITASRAIYYNGIMYQVGDIVCTCDIIEGGTYYAQVRGFLQDEYCEKYVVVTWLIPTRYNVKNFDPMLFVPGLDEEIPRTLSSFDFVCHASKGLFQSPKTVHPLNERSQTNLENLIVAANSMKDVGGSQSTVDTVTS